MRLFWRLPSLIVWVLVAAFLLVPGSEPARAAATPITFESPGTSNVVLGDLASRSKNAQLSRSGIASPYTMSAAATTAPRFVRPAYTFTTDASYGATSGSGWSGCTVGAAAQRGCGTQLRESDERVGASMTYNSSNTGTDTGKTGIITLTQSGNINGTPVGGRGGNQMADGNYSFGAIFGPQIYSNPFVGNPGQAVSYQWKATGSGDDYEVYGFLVKISADTSSCTTVGMSGNYGTTNPTSTHSILSYGRGKIGQWTTVTGTITETSCYRFRFVGGTYDASGGLAVGGTYYIYGATLGDAQSISFTQPNDMTRSSSDQTFTVTASSNASGASLVYSSDTTSLCTINTFGEVTVKANQSGTCTLRIDSAAVSSYGAAPTAIKSFLVQVSATKPVSSGGDSITGSAKVCSTLSVSPGSWTDGGSAITGTTYQWKRNGLAIIGATSSTYVIQAADVGTAISYDITKTNGVGSTTATSSSQIPVDSRLSNLVTSVGTLSPTFNGCTNIYSTTVATSSITITPTLASGDASVKVAGTTVISGRASGAIPLTAGSNVISIVTTNGTESTTNTLTVTYAEAPTVTILAPSSVTGTGATFNATINANGQTSSNINFEISTSSSFASDVTAVNYVTNYSDANNHSISAASPTLTFQTTYYLRASATNATGTTTSTIFTFTTPAAPLATTSSASSLTATGATLNGSVVGNGDLGGTSTTVVFQYSINSDMSSPTEISPTLNGSISGGDTNTTAISKALTGLQTGSTYYFRVKASNNYGTNYGSILNFTLIGAPTSTTSAPTGANLGSTSVKLVGTVNAKSDPTTSISFKWGATSSPSTVLATTPTSVTGNSDTTVEATLTGLTKSTTYWFYLTATNSSGTTNSTQYSFTTAADPVPTAVLTAPSNSLLTQPFTLTVTFSEPVNGFLSSDLTLSGATTGWTVGVEQQISSSLYTVEFSPTGAVSGGTYTIGLGANKVQDLGSQNNTAATSINVVLAAALAPPDISYPSYSISLNKNTAMTTLTPTNSGGVISSWTLPGSPALPAGLSFNTSTGEFSGTPTAEISATNYVVTASNVTASGTTQSVSKTISITVGAPLPLPVISYSPSTITSTVGTAISTVTPTNTGQTATSWSISSTLPSGFSFSTVTGAISGTPSATASSATYTVTANSVNGSSTTTFSLSATAANTAPSAPTIGTATATGSTSATVTFSAPGSNGGATITTYTATSTPGGFTGSISQSGSGTITVTGLSPNTSYTFKVSATNSVGTSALSSSSNSVTTSIAAPSISYTSYTLSLHQGNAMSTLSPTNSGGVVESWALSNSGALPNGITFSSGQFSGTPTVQVGSTSFVVTATNTTGSDTKTVTIEVGAPLPTPVISYSPSTISAIVGTAINSVTPTNAGQTATSWSISPSLPAGLAIDSTTGVISGTTTAISSTSAYTITANSVNGSGTTTISVTSRSVPDAPTIGLATATGPTSATIAFIAPISDGGDSITAYSVISTPGSITGTLNQSGSGTFTLTGLTANTTYTFTVTATNSIGVSLPSSSSNSVSTSMAAPIISYASYNLVLQQGTAMTTLIPTNLGGVISTWAISNSSALPSGLSFESTSGQIAGTPTVIASSLSFIITATNTTGSDSKTVTIEVTAQVSASNPIILPSSLVTFAQNGADTPSLPQSEILGDTKALWKNIMTRAGYTFAGWNTKADGTGTAYADGAQFKFDAPTITLYAQWKLIQTKPTITWANPAAIQEGTALGATQLNALASVPGTYTYSPASAALLPVGKNTLKVVFVPTDAKYETIETTVEIEVLAKAKVTWVNPAAIQEGTPLGGTQLNATASVPGTFTYEPKDGAVLTPGKYTLKVTFTPTDSRLSPVTAEVTLEVTAKPVVIPAAPVSPTYSVTGAPKSTITWGAGKDAATYTVLVDGKNACSVAVLTCEVAKLLGPKNVVTVTSVATNGKTSDELKANYLSPTLPLSIASFGFESGHSTLKASEIVKLKSFALTVRTAGYTTLTVFGHTDSVGGVDNQKLSVARANATITYLKKLLPGVTFAVSGFAASEPVADNSTAEGKAANRRAEIFIP